MATFTGTSGDDYITSYFVSAGVAVNPPGSFTSVGADSVDGGAGSDVIDGDGGADTINGGAGDDSIAVEDGYAFSVNGGTGYDTLSILVGPTQFSYHLNLAAIGFEDVNTGSLNDTIDASGVVLENTTLSVNIDAGAGNDLVIGSAFSDVIYAYTGNDTIFGNEGADYINGGSGQCSIDAGGGDRDYVFVSTNYLYVNGGAGVFDKLEAVGGNASRYIDVAASGFEDITLGDGNDTIDASGVTVNTFYSFQGLRGNDSIVGSKFNDVIYGGAGADTLIGGDGNDGINSQYGSASGADSILAGAGDDGVSVSADYAFVDGGDGFDTLFLDTSTGLSINLMNIHFERVEGGFGNDTLDGSTQVVGVGLDGWGGGDSLIGGAFNDTFDGGDGADTILGGDGADSITGSAGADSMVGGPGADTLVSNMGADTLVGGPGADLFAFRSGAGAGNHVTDFVDGSDKIDLTGRYVRFTDVVVTATADGTRISVGGDAFILDGIASSAIDESDFLGLLSSNIPTAGNDTILGSSGDDSVNALGGDDSVSGLAGKDTLLGLTGADTLLGGDGNDSLDGGKGADSLIGGPGNDTYILDNVGDVVVEDPTGGEDLISSKVTRTLGTNVENLTLTGTATINGTGNELNNIIVGNAAINTLSGVDGNDSLNGGNGNDKLFGGDGNDTIDGGKGADAMDGGAGSDVYFVDNAGDTVTDGGAGIDSVESTVTYTLGASIENLTLKKTAVINGTGNELANVIIGNSAVNTLVGLGGADSLSGGGANDMLNGGLGADTLSGGAKYDRFDYNAAAESGPGVLLRDVITAFDGAGAAAGDLIDLADVVGGKLAFVAAGSAFTGASQVRVVEDGTGNSLVQVNLDTNLTTSEMEILIVDAGRHATAYTSADFIL